jgi:hypothetical protein
MRCVVSSASSASPPASGESGESVDCQRPAEATGRRPSKSTALNRQSPLQRTTREAVRALASRAREQPERSDSACVAARWHPRTAGRIADDVSRGARADWPVRPTRYAGAPRLSRRRLLLFPGRSGVALRSCSSSWVCATPPTSHERLDSRRSGARLAGRASELLSGPVRRRVLASVGADAASTSRTTTRSAP